MSVRTKDDLGRALGCVIYDALILLIALSVFRRRKQCPMYEGLQWGEPQIAVDVILVKFRSLIDFLAPKHSHPDDISITDFGCPPVVLPATIKTFRKSINQWSAHLTWQRALSSQSLAPQPARPDIDSHAFWLVTTIEATIRDCLSTNIVLVEDRHLRFYRVFQSEFVKLTSPSLACVTETPFHSQKVTTTPTR